MAEIRVKFNLEIGEEDTEMWAFLSKHDVYLFFGITFSECMLNDTQIADLKDNFIRLYEQSSLFLMN